LLDVELLWPPLPVVKKRNVGALGLSFGGVFVEACSVIEENELVETCALLGLVPMGAWLPAKELGGSNKSESSTAWLICKPDMLFWPDPILLFVLECNFDLQFGAAPGTLQSVATRFVPDAEALLSTLLDDEEKERGQPNLFTICVLAPGLGRARALESIEVVDAGRSSSMALVPNIPNLRRPGATELLLCDAADASPSDELVLARPSKPPTQPAAGAAPPALPRLFDGNENADAFGSTLAPSGADSCLGKPKLSVDFKLPSAGPSSDPGFPLLR
jgi:hypothetical protein